MIKTKNELTHKKKSLMGSSVENFEKNFSELTQKLLNELQICHQALDAKNEEVDATLYRYMNLYNVFPVGLLTLNLDDGKVLTGNPVAWQKLSVSCDELIGQKFREYIHPSDREAFNRYLHSQLTQATNLKLRVKLNSATRTAPEIHCKGIDCCDCTPKGCVFDKELNCVELCSVVTESVSKYRQIILSITDIAESQSTQVMIDCLNHKLEQKIREQTRELEKYRHELNIRAEEIKHLMRQSAEGIVQSAASDISRQGAQSLLISEYSSEFVINLGQLNAIFNVAVEGIIIIDSYFNIVSINQTAENIFGYNQDEIIGGNMDKLIPESEQSQVPCRRINDYPNRLFNTIGKARECSGLNKNGIKVPLEVTIAKFCLNDNVYLAVIVRDISVRKLEEQRNKEHLDELAHVTRMGLLGELASGIAHEVNQPLSAIVNYSQACLRLIQNDYNDPSQLSEILRKTSQQAIKAGQIIHGLRNLVKAKRVRHSLIDINKLVCDAAELCVSYIKQNDVSLYFELNENIPLIFVDVVQIEQVVLNLIKNSLDSLSRTAYSDKRNLRIITSINNKYIEVSVSDNGAGIECADQEKIFTPFYTTKDSGMGMGLSICRSIVEAHEGEINFTSNPGKGTTFYFSLPIRKRRQ